MVSYGGDGLTCRVPDEVYSDYGLELPRELRESLTVARDGPSSKRGRRMPYRVQGTGLKTPR